MRRVGFVFDERYLWHDTGVMQPGPPLVEQYPHWESPETKRRFKNLLECGHGCGAGSLFGGAASAWVLQALSRGRLPEFIDGLNNPVFAHDATSSTLTLQ
jgi:hypothetical protein